jgi:nucleoside-diphosphate-sugar epimerase
MSEKFDLKYLSQFTDVYQNKSVLITGAAGFFGSWMNKALDGHFVAFADRVVYKTLLEDRYDYIFHFAPTPIEPVIECAKRSGAKILYASSGAVYGSIGVKVDEDYQTNPKTEYGIEKLRSENILKNSGLDYCIARLFTFCGTGLKNNFAVTNFIDDIKNDRPIKVLWPHTVRSYMYIVDAISWLLVLMQSENGVYNVGSEKAITVGKLAELASSFTIPRNEIVISDNPFIDPAPYYVPDCSKAHELGLEQHFSLNYGIERMLE